ncbi:hypothetical protein [Streptomyces sp. NPDC056987]|uniref:hypothetical protein n=1 Tax=Streptomyces sp. NPDC056987 TaxID=3345988 RepID=UPI0036363E7C
MNTSGTCNFLRAHPFRFPAWAFGFQLNLDLRRILDNYPWTSTPLANEMFK